MTPPSCQVLTHKAQKDIPLTFIVSSQGGRGKGPLLGPLYKATNPDRLPKAPPPKLINSVLSHSFQHYEF
jgi:hypothetical protein